MPLKPLVGNSEQLKLSEKCAQRIFPSEFHTPRRPIGRPKIRWGDDVRKDIQKIKVPNWKTLAQDRKRWKELVEKAKTL
jgi:hypothetical protein